MSNLKRWCMVAAFALPVLWADSAEAHAMPLENAPRAGSMLTQAPATVSIRFDSDLEPIFSRLIVMNAAGRQVSRGNGAVDAANARILVTHLLDGAKGVYRVYWSVVSRDGHRTEGDYTFTVE